MDEHLITFSPEQHQQAQRAITAVSTFLARFVTEHPHSDRITPEQPHTCPQHQRNTLTVDDLHQLIHLADMRRTFELVTELNKLYPVHPGTLFTVVGDLETEVVSGLTQAIHMLAGHAQIAVIASRPDVAFTPLTPEQEQALNAAGWYRKPF